MLFDAARGRNRAAARAPRKLGPLALLRKFGGRLGWGVADQGVSSLTNFAVNLYIARELGAIQYGAFSLAFVTYGFALNASRGLATDPLLVRFSYAEPTVWRRAVTSCTGTAVNVGLATGVLVLAAAAVLGGTTGAAFLALGLTLPGLMLQDSWRFAFFTAGRGRDAFLNDLIWALVLGPALVALKFSGHATVFWCVFAWGGAATVAAAAGPLQARVMPRLRDIVSWLQSHRDLGIRYMAEGASNSLSTQLRNYGIGAVLGLAAVGYVQAASTLMGPFMVIITGTGLIITPEATKIWREKPRKMPKYCIAVSAGFTILGLTWGAFLLLALPHGLGQGLLGAIWRPSYSLVAPTAAAVMGFCATAGAGTALHALGAARRSLRAAVISSVMYVLGSLAGGLEAGALGAVIGYAVAAWLGVAVYWWQAAAALRETGRLRQISDDTMPHQFFVGREPGRHRTDLPRTASTAASPVPDPPPETPA